jgi:hypothetical protein
MRRTALVACVLGLVVLTGCSSGSSSGGGDKAASAPSPEATSASSSAPPPPVAPRVGSCHALTLGEATAPVEAGPAVPCRGAHTSVTVKVGRLTPLVDGHLLAVDSRTVRARVQKACPSSGIGYAGGDTRTQRLSRLEVVWFTPSLEQADAGAAWYRCDLVGLASAGTLITLPPRMKGVLAAGGALDRFGTCGTAAPGARGFERVVCSRRHAWRAVDVIELGARTRYLDKAAGASGDASCKDTAAARANGALKYTWSFEWPTRAQWNAGQRYGYCWLPGV